MNVLIQVTNQLDQLIVVRTNYCKVVDERVIFLIEFGQRFSHPLLQGVVKYLRHLELGANNYCQPISKLKETYFISDS